MHLNRYLALISIIAAACADPGVVYVQPGDRPVVRPAEELPEASGPVGTPDPAPQPTPVEEPAPIEEPVDPEPEILEIIIPFGDWRPAEVLVVEYQGGGVIEPWVRDELELVLGSRLTWIETWHDLPTILRATGGPQIDLCVPDFGWSDVDVPQVLWSREVLVLVDPRVDNYNCPPARKPLTVAAMTGAPRAPALLWDPEDPANSALAMAEELSPTPVYPDLWLELDDLSEPARVPCDADDDLGPRRPGDEVCFEMPDGCQSGWIVYDGGLTIATGMLTR